MFEIQKMYMLARLDSAGWVVDWVGGYMMYRLYMYRFPKIFCRDPSVQKTNIGPESQVL